MNEEALELLRRIADDTHAIREAVEKMAKPLAWGDKISLDLEKRLGANMMSATAKAEWSALQGR